MTQFDSMLALESALADLGELLERRGTPFALFVIGGGAHLLLEPSRAQATGDLDVAAQVLADGTLVTPVPLPEPLAEAARIVARIHDLSPGWLNSAAAASFDDLVPDGALERATRRTWGALTILVAARNDLIELKLRAAHRRGEKGDRYRRDLAFMRPTDDELATATAHLRAGSGSTTPAAWTAEVLASIRRYRDA